MRDSGRLMIAGGQKNAPSPGHSLKQFLKKLWAAVYGAVFAGHGTVQRSSGVITGPHQ